MAFFGGKYKENGIGNKRKKIEKLFGYRNFWRQGEKERIVK